MQFLLFRLLFDTGFMFLTANIMLQFKINRTMLSTNSNIQIDTGSYFFVNGVKLLMMQYFGASMRKNGNCLHKLPYFQEISDGNSDLKLTFCVC